MNSKHSSEVHFWGRPQDLQFKIDEREFRATG